VGFSPPLHRTIPTLHTDLVVACRIRCGAFRLQEEQVRTAAPFFLTIPALRSQPEQVHRLLSMPPERSMAGVVGRLRRAGALRAQFPAVREAHDRSLWTAGNLERTQGAVPVAQVKAYPAR
jgi:REP element-mobilizing transposase RayT